MKRLIIPVLSIITIAISILNFALYDVSKAAIVFCNEGSYAHEWATEHNATVELIAESDEHIFSVSLENFKYNFDGNTAVIVEYNGKSETIAIPYFIEGRVVYKVEQDAFDNASNLKSIYVPNSVQEFEATDLENITVFCEKDSATWIVLEEAQKVAEEEYNSKMENVQEGEEELVMAVTTQFEELLDSDFVNFSSSYIPFSYDTENGKINLSRYLEDTDFVVVPTHIDGKEVSEISFPVLEAGITTIVIPDTVTKINSDICTNRYDARFFVGMGILWLGYLIAIGTSIIAFKNNDTLNKKFLGVPFIFSGGGS